MVKRIFLTSGLIIFAVLVRLGRFIPNVEVVTLVTFLAAFYLGKKEAVIVALSSMAISDVIIGNTNISLFTWSAYGMIAVGAYFCKNMSKRIYCSSPPTGGRELIKGFDFSLRSKNIIQVLFATFGCFISTLWFYLWTNFGVWFLDSWNMYPKTLNGLITCYINGLPFLRNQMVGNLIIVPVGFIVIELILKIKKLTLFIKKVNVCIN